jgi:chromosome segregation ATPase
MHDLESAKERAQSLETALEIRQHTISQLELQLEEERQARIQVTTQDEVQSLQEILAKEFQRNNELTSLLEDKETDLRNLKENIEHQQNERAKELISRDERIRELESAYSEQVQKNREEYLQLEEAIEERETTYAERLGQLEVISDGQEHEIQRLQAKIEELQSESTNKYTYITEIRQAESLLQDREKYISELSRSLGERSQKIKQYEVALADAKRKAADDVFESTKRERRIEKLLDDREMLNIAVEQLQIQIQLVSTFPYYRN